MRDPFFRSLATELERYPETGVGLVFRVGSQLQREFLRPPSGHMPVLSRNTGGREPGVISSVTAAGYFFRYHSAINALHRHHPRSPSGAPHAALAGALTSRLSSGPCFLNSAHSGRYPLACKPSAGTAPPAAAVVPQGVMPEAAGERFARPFPAVRLRLHHQRLGTSANRHFVGHFVDSVHVLPPLPRSSFAMAASAILSVRAK
jgi:hypothetical protein